MFFRFDKSMVLICLDRCRKRKMKIRLKERFPVVLFWPQGYFPSNSRNILRNEDLILKQNS